MNKSNRGGLRNPPGGRPPKAPEQKRVKRLISLPPEIAEKLSQVENASELITKLLAEYFERNPKVTKNLITNSYYTVTRINEAVIDGELQAQFLVKLEIWSEVYGDSLVDSEMLMSGTANEVQDYLTQNSINEVITVGL